jgi:outer membrane immunogenic protein
MLGRALLVTLHEFMSASIRKFFNGGGPMKKLLFGGAPLLSTLVAIGSAVAADIPMRREQPVPAPAMTAAFSWTGCYFGGYAGGGWSGGSGAIFADQGQNGLGPAGSIATPPFQSYSGGASASRLVAPHSFNADLDASAIGGGTLGCNWQVPTSPWVFGIEGEVGYLHLNGSSVDPNTLKGTQTTLDVLGSGKVGDWFAMATGRLGYAWNRTLVYVKGGAAWVPTKASVVDTCQTTTPACGNWLIATSGSNTVTTWTLGGGIEWPMAQSWTVKAEYMFIALSDDSGFQRCASAIAPSGNPVAGGPFCFNSSFSGVHTAKIGLNYRFGGTPF